MLTSTSDLMVVPRAPVSSSSTTLMTHATPSGSSTDTNGKAVHSRFAKTDLPTLHQAVDAVDLVVDAADLGVDLQVAAAEDSAAALAVVEEEEEEASAVDAEVSEVATVAEEVPMLAVLLAAWTLLPSSHKLLIPSPIMPHTAASLAQLSTFATFHGLPATRTLLTSSPPSVP